MSVTCNHRWLTNIPAQVTSKLPPWRTPRPAGTRNARLTEDEKRRARARAVQAGRRYPNLVDNLAILAQRKRSGNEPT